jgi:hypothetical protein
MDTDRKIIKFLASTGFSVVLEFGSIEVMKEYEDRIKESGLQCEIIANFNLNFDQADLFMDMRSPVCQSQFDLEDWI